MINAIIMASGFSSRMGTNKLLLPYKEKALIEHILDKVKECDFFSTVLVAQNFEVIGLAKKRGLKVIYNERAKNGQSESIKSGILNSPDAMGYAFFTADQPLIDIKTIKFLMDSFYKEKDSIIIPIFEEKRGTPVIFPKKFKEELLALEGDAGGRTIIKKYMNSVKLIEVREECILWDIDTQEDYRNLIHSVKQ